MQRFPKSGRPEHDLLDELRQRRRQDADWRDGRLFSLVYSAGERIDALHRDAARIQQHGNALHPGRFPSVRALEVELVEMTGDLLHAPAGFGGCLTSGGSESILLAVLTARERARTERGVARPAILAPRSIHPAFAKAAKYLGMELRLTALGTDQRADVRDLARRVDGDVALIAASAPGYPHGVLDPIEEIAAVASREGIAFHVDACVGGFFLPFLERIVPPVPPFDFRVDGTSTISVDLHKYGYAPKGVSVLLHREAQHMNQHQFFLYDAWAAGLYGTFGVAGSRSAAPIAAAWAVVRHLGEEGYLQLVASVMETTRKIRAGIESIPGLYVVGAPVMSVLAFGAREGDVPVLADAMDARGWHLDRQRDPESLHLVVTPAHEHVVDRFLADLSAAADEARARASEAPRASDGRGTT